MILNGLQCCPRTRRDKKRRKEAKSSETCRCGVLDGALVAVTRLIYPSPSWSPWHVLNLSLPWQVCCSLEQTHDCCQQWSDMIPFDTCHFLSSKSNCGHDLLSDRVLETPNHLEQIHFEENGFKAAPVFGVLRRKLMPVQHSSLSDTVPDSLLLPFLKKGKQEKPLYPLPSPQKTQTF